MPINNAFLIFFSGCFISDVIKVTLFQVIEANKAPTTLMPIALIIEKSKLGSTEKFLIKISKLKPKNIPQTIIPTMDKILVTVKILCRIMPSFIPLEFIYVIKITANIARSDSVDNL